MGDDNEKRKTEVTGDMLGPEKLADLEKQFGIPSLEKVKEQ